MLKNFKINQKNVDTSLLDNIFDFVIIGLVAVIFANFGQSLVKHSVLNIVFSIANLMMVSSNWYAYNFYSIRYQERNSFHLWIMIPIIFSLIVFGIGIKSAYTSSSIETKFLLIGGFILSRFFIGFVFVLVDYVNKNRYVSIMCRWKYYSRFFAIIIVVINAFTKLINIKYLFLILAIIEVLGNIWQVRNKYLTKLPPIDFKHLQMRFTKLNSLYIGSFIIASINFYSNYVNKGSLLNLLYHLLIFISIGVMIWIIYNQRITKFEMNSCAKTLLLFAISTLIIDIGTCIIGSTFLYIDDFNNMDSTIPLIGLLILILGLFSFLFSAKWKTKRLVVKKYKIIEYLVYLTLCMVLIILNLKTIHFNLIFVFIILISLIVNYTIQKKKYS